MKTDTRLKPRWLALTVCLAIPLLAGGFSAFLTAEDMNIYETLNRPFLAPPGWVFPIAWTVLYLLMGAAAYLVFVSDASAENKRKALLLFTAQLLMNFFWSTLFFSYGRFLLSLLWLLVMWVLVLLCVIRFYRIRHAAGFMMAVLSLWLSFAAYLNLSYYLMSITPMPIADVQVFLP